MCPATLSPFEPKIRAATRFSFLILLAGFIAAPAFAYHCEADRILVDVPAGLPQPLLLRKQSDMRWLHYAVSFDDPPGVDLPERGSVDATLSDAYHTVSRADFDGDGEPDLLTRDLTGENNGRWLLYTLKGGEVTSSGFVNGIKNSRTWQLASTGDFDGDGKADILLRNAETGGWILYLMNGKKIRNSGAVELSDSLSDVVVGVGDTNADGRADVLMRRSNGRWLLYIMRGLNAPQKTRPAISRKAEFGVEAFVDFTGDGRVDLLLRSLVSGKWKLHLLNGGTVEDYGPVELPTNLSIHLESTADFNGDGRADALLRKKNGSWLLYTIDGLTVLANGQLALPKASQWLIVTTDEYTGDGMADVLMRRADGRWNLYAIDGDAISVLRKGQPAITTQEEWIPQVGCLHTDEDNDVLLGQHISTSGAQTVAQQALSDGLSMGLGGVTSLFASEPFIVLLKALGFTVTTSTTEDGAVPLARRKEVLAALPPADRLREALSSVAIDPDQVQDEMNVGEQEAIDLASALLQNPTRTGNMVIYRPDPEATCALESVVSFIESLDSDVLTLENCADVIAEMSITQTVVSDDVGRVSFSFGEHEPLAVTYSPDVGTSIVDFDATRESIILLIDILEPLDPPAVPETLTGEVQTTIVMDSVNVHTTTVSITRALDISSISDGQVVSFVIEARDEVYVSTVDDDLPNVASTLNMPPVTISLPVEDINDETIIYPGTIVIPGISGQAELSDELMVLTLDSVSFGGAPITYDVNDQRALEMKLDDLDLDLDANGNTITLPLGLSFDLALLAVPGVADVGDAGSIAYDVLADSQFLVIDVPATDTEDAYAIIKVVRGQFDAAGTGALEDSSLTLLSGRCYRSTDGVWGEVTCPLP